MFIDLIIDDINNNQRSILIVLGIIFSFHFIMRYLSGLTYSGKKYEMSVIRGKLKAGTASPEDQSKLTTFNILNRSTYAITILLLCSLPFTYWYILDYAGQYVIKHIDYWPYAIAAFFGLAILRTILAIIKLRLVAWQVKRARAKNA